MTLNRELPPIEEAAEALNARHRYIDMHARRQEAILAGQSLLNVEQLEKFFDAHREAFGPDGEPNYGCTCTVGHLEGGYRAHAARAIRADRLGEHA